MKIVGPVSVLVNCAGYAVVGRFEETAVEDFKVRHTDFLSFPSFAGRNQRSFQVLGCASGVKILHHWFEECTEFASRSACWLSAATRFYFWSLLCKKNFTKLSAFFQKQIDANYLSSVHATRSVIAGMKQQNSGRIVFTSSQAGQLGVFGYTAYSASKFALRGFAEALQMEVCSV